MHQWKRKLIYCSNKNSLLNIWHEGSQSTSGHGLTPGWTWSCRRGDVSPEPLPSSRRRLWDIPRDCNSSRAIYVVLTLRYKQHVRAHTHTHSQTHSHALADSRSWRTKWDMRECIIPAYGDKSVRENSPLFMTFSQYRLPTCLQNPGTRVCGTWGYLCMNYAFHVA